MTATNDDIARMLHELRREGAEGRDAMMARLGSLESTQKTLANGLAEVKDDVHAVRAQAERAEKTALEAKRRTTDSMHEMQSTFEAVTAHVDGTLKPLQENDELQNVELARISATLKGQNRTAVELSERTNQRLTIYTGALAVLVPVIQQLLGLIIKP